MRNQQRKFTICIGETSTCNDCLLKIVKPLNQREKGVWIHFANLQQTESFLYRNPEIIDKIGLIFMTNQITQQAAGIINKVFAKQTRPAIHFCHDHIH